MQFFCYGRRRWLGEEKGREDVRIRKRQPMPQCCWWWCTFSCCPAEFLEGFDGSFVAEEDRRQQLERAVVQEMAAISQVGGDVHTSHMTASHMTPVHIHACT